MGGGLSVKGAEGGGHQRRGGGPGGQGRPPKSSAGNEGALVLALP